MLKLLDLFFFFFHTGLILFNLLGWCHPLTRRWHLLTLSLTLVSWIGMGAWYGWGYCICTDMHWRVLRELGENGLPYSYITYLVERISGFSPSARTSDIAAVLGVLLPLLLSLYLEWQHRKKKRSSYIRG